METYRFQPGETPVLISLPHVGTDLPLDIAAGMTDTAHQVPDTDWHLDRLYNFAPAFGVGFLAATQSRYVIDLNRDPAGHGLYRGRDNTELCPTTSFDEAEIYNEGCHPDGVEVRRRIGAYWQPYHRQLREELASLKERFGIAVLFDAHSINSTAPRFIESGLCDFNLVTADGTSASPHLSRRLANVLACTDAYSSKFDRESKGGYNTRHYGRPEDNIHVIQLEVSQATYMEETAPFRYRADRAALVRPVLERFVSALVEWSWENAEVRRQRVAYY
ncbi:N-formylglutamate amidohydrolase [Skermanella stibiiresistens SB22]|uniref:N-formylglutamate amidohydrolase n=1 Tax=Skermanella stibiiresistens SB22 TaxID=1385369 RepID=W9H501_9PROT|nr:N-formylglutamate deformylase [Skermanella stibiiresistens]EWY38843.1 N-formylglutamate amidohydrolase [Skermanella stibiiresistens SB22]